MKTSDLQHLRCPACQGELTLRAETREEMPPGFDPETMMWEGALHCAACGSRYPMLEGVACLARIDGRWLVPLKELKSRLAMVLRVLEPQAWEQGREEAYQEAEHVAHTGMKNLFDIALEEIDFSREPLILDVGAGPCRTTDEFLARGARAIALDCDLPQLRFLSFEGVDKLPPESWVHPVSGFKLTMKDAQPLRNYFTRVFGDVGRLPFPDAHFDVVFCRSVLHHLEDHARTMREMMRVLKPGGKLIVCAEPIRSVLEREEDLFDHCVMREEGMNDRAWPYYQYTRPIRGATRDLVIHTWVNPPSRRLRRRAPVLADWLSRRIGPGARVHGWQLPALMFCQASVNFYATKRESATEAGAPPPPPAGLTGSVEEDNRLLVELTELFRGRQGGLEANVAEVPGMRRKVGALLRKVMATTRRPPARRMLAQTPMHELIRGWLDPASHEGRTGRVIARECSCALGAPEGANKVQITLAATGAANLTLKVWVNDEPCGSLAIAGGSWRTVACDLPALDGPVALARLRCEFASAEDAAQTQVIVESIEIR